MKPDYLGDGVYAHHDGDLREAQARHRWVEALAAVNRFTSLPIPDDEAGQDEWGAWTDQGEAVFCELHAARILLNEARTERTGADARRDAAADEGDPR
jgi:hypothetical protein